MPEYQPPLTVEVQQALEQSPKARAIHLLLHHDVAVEVAGVVNLVGRFTGMRIGEGTRSNDVLQVELTLPTGTAWLWLGDITSVAQLLTAPLEPTAAPWHHNIKRAIAGLQWLETDLAFKAPEQAAGCMEGWNLKILGVRQVLEGVLIGSSAPTD